MVRGIQVVVKNMANFRRSPNCMGLLQERT